MKQREMQMSDRLMIGISGVRGVIGEAFTPPVIIDLVGAFGTLMEGGDIIVARDSRTSGPMVQHIVTGMLTALGCDVIDLGISPTPTAMLAVERLNANGGIVVTASHNPAKWNALKFVNRSGMFLDEEHFQELVEIYQKNDFSFVSWENIGCETSYGNAVSDHIDSILDLELVDGGKLRSRRLKVVVDACCGAGGVIIPQLLRQLGCHVIEMHCEPSGLFPRDPEPTAANLGALAKRVLAEGADLGIANDADVDRIALVSEEGEPIGEEYSLVIAADYVLGKKPGLVVTNLSTSRMIDVVAGKYGCEVIRTKVGEINVARTMKQRRAIIGGEGNGGIILPELHFTRDAPLGAALILSHLVASDMPLSGMVGTLPAFVMRKEAFPVTTFAMEEFSEKCERVFPTWAASTLDGLRLDSEEGWIHVRPSNTEPIVRIIIESGSDQECDILFSKVTDILYQ